MRHPLILLTLACLSAGLPVTRASAQFIPLDGIYTDTSKKPQYREFVIASESPRALVLKSPKVEIPADKIVDIIFPLKPNALHLGAYRQAIIAEKTAMTATKAAERNKGNTLALAKYQETLDMLEEGQPYVKAHLEYKIANLLYTQGRDEGKEAALTQAAEKLKAFKTAHPQAWQLVPVLRMLAGLQLDARNYAEAEQTYRELAKSNAPDEVRQDAEVQALLVTVQAGKYAEAQKSLAELVNRLPKGSTQQLRARLALAECLGVAKDLARAKAEVKIVLDQTKDKALRGLAYSTMGYCYYVNEQWQDARWEFLWVDTIYNQDPREHARALYYLSDIFARLGEGDRARECREQLLTGRQFSGLEYQRRAMKDSK